MKTISKRRTFKQQAQRMGTLIKLKCLTTSLMASPMDLLLQEDFQDLEEDLEVDLEEWEAASEEDSEVLVADLAVEWVEWEER